MSWLTGYTTRRKLTIDCTKIDSALSDFPILVKLTSTQLDFSKANSDGFDIRFTSSDGTTLLKYERERHDSGSSLAEYWVKVSSISAASDTDIYMYYRTTDTANGEDITNVWDSNFGLVYHLDNATTTTVADSTSNDFTGTKTSTDKPLEENSKIAKGQYFDGTDHINTVNDPFSATDLADGATLECFYKTTSTDDITTYIVSLEGFIILSLDVSGSDYKIMSSADGGGNFQYSAVGMNDGVWRHIAVIWDGTDTARLYVNGVEVDNSTSNAPSLSTTRPLSVGEHSSDSHYYTGSVDEVRLSKAYRTAAWQKGSYNSGNNSLLTYGDEEKYYIPRYPAINFQIPAIV